jgi:transglutaminase-like putative cysteine protease
MRQRIPTALQRPTQGWSTLLLMLGMLTIAGLTVTESVPLPLGGSDRSGVMVVLIVVAGLIGFLLARSRLGVVRAQVFGAAAAAAILLLVAGAALAQPLVATSNVLPLEWSEVGIRLGLLKEEVRVHLARPELWQEESPTALTFLVLGAICWTTAQFSAFSIFRYDRGGPAVMASGIVMLLASGLAAFDTEVEVMSVLPQLALFSTLAMLLLMRLQLTQQSYQWARRHISDSGEVARLFLRSGTAFVLLSVLGASTLTLAATTGPHEAPVDEINDVLDDLGNVLAPVFSVFGARIDSDALTSIEDSFKVADSWPGIEGTAFTATFENGDPGGHYWWMSAHSSFDGSNWSWPSTEEIEADVGEPLPIDKRLQSPFARIEVTIDIDDPPNPLTVVSPADAAQVLSPVVIKAIGPRGGADRVDIGMINFQDTDTLTSLYEVKARARTYDSGPTSLTADKLRTAAQDYPGWVKDRYLSVEDSATGTLTKETAARIFDLEDNDYDRALRLQDELRVMEYNTDPVDCGGLNIPECLLTEHKGFCQTYASTMAMVLREMGTGIPSRLVRGFLPGEPQGEGVWKVENAAYHAWVEVYFPKYGWIRFDPTPGRVQSTYGLAPTDLLDEGPSPGSGETPPPTLEPTSPPPSLEPEPSLGPGTAGSGGDDDQGDALAAFIIGGGIAGLLLLVTFGLLFVRLRRLPGADSGLAYLGIVSLATRLGYGPHPTQTEFEYAGTLSESIPSVRDDLYLVADARVETAYGQRDIEASRVGGLRRAYARIRTALLRLSLRRGR